MVIYVLVASPINRRHLGKIFSQEWRLSALNTANHSKDLRQRQCRLFLSASWPQTSSTIHEVVCRNFSSSSSSSRSPRDDNDTTTSMKNLYALPFTVSPDQALKSFNKWAIEEQGLNYLINWQSIRIGAAYAPVWSFNVNIRYIRTDYPQSRRYSWKPEMFAVYGTENSVVHLPGLSSYAGYSFRRTLIDPVHSTTLVFRQGDVVPFGSWMLRDMEVSGQKLSIVPDAWNATKQRAFALLREELVAQAQASVPDPATVRVQTRVVSSRRVYMPTYFIDYKVFGMEYRAFVSGGDTGGAVSGVSHKVFDMNNEDIRQATNSILSGALSGARIVTRNRQLLGTALFFLQFVLSLLGRVLVRIPVIGVVAGALVGFRKILQPWMANRSATVEWEREREHQASADDDAVPFADFDDDGSAETFFRNNREQILRHLGGDQRHGHGDFDWYSEWEKWARQQWERQQQQQQQTYGGQQQQQASQKYQQKSKPEYQWDFDPDDPYSVLGIKRGASLAEISAAFRKQMLIHHPDVQSGASDAQKQRAAERSKLISAAYRKLKTELKR